MTLGSYARLVLRHRLLVTIVVLGCALVALAVSLALPKTYTSTTTSFLTTSDQATTPDALYQNSQFALNQVQSYPPIVTSARVLGPVIDDLGLDLTVPELARQVTATNPAGTVLIRIEVTSPSARTARAVADGVAASLSALADDLQGEASDDTGGFGVGGLRGAPDGDAPSLSIQSAVPALEPTSPSSPDLLLNTALGLVVGLALGPLAAVLRDTRRQRREIVRSTGQIEPHRALGAVPHVAGSDEDPLLASALDSPALESLRSIRATVGHGTDGRPVRHLVVSTPTDGAVSAFAVSLAVVTARSRVRVCLVAADLRPTHTTLFTGVQDRDGLAEVLTGSCSVQDALVPWDGPDLQVLPPGRTTPAARDLLGSQTGQELFARLRKQFDLVIVAAPPLLEVNDAVDLAEVGDGVVLVLRHGLSRRADLDRAVARLDELDLPLAGVVLDGAPPAG